MTVWSEDRTVIFVYEIVPLFPVIIHAGQLTRANMFSYFKICCGAQRRML